ncbi:N-formylglutamate amidohydrolase [Crateriforma conspicua]|uniref:N-formylglutamate amidohydrolase n=1 Tax=Crateriforma conspicua TaxID=2527996 RepID=A0A5C6FL59_9PLAN|nr:N-formylglutamate amidohydrolase [Crateriforma conspicua]TWU62757.1 N-formylglutamate amidohydrolase [Crateriforma conspicua]
MTGPAVVKVLVTCEHATNRVPPEFFRWFDPPGARADLKSHRGYDPGADEASRELAGRLKCHRIVGQQSRLLIDLNRSLGHQELFSKYTDCLDPAIKERVIADYYEPYRQKVHQWIVGQPKGCPVLHLSVHTFTPRYRGKHRQVDVGLLYDPKREAERQLCQDWARRFRRQQTQLCVRMNQPYRGIDDGFTTCLRQLDSSPQYAGVEIEINHRIFKHNASRFLSIVRSLADSLCAIPSMPWAGATPPDAVSTQPH